MTKNKKQIPDHVHDTADVAQKLDASIFDVWNLAIQNEIGLNISKAKEMLGYEPKISLEKGMKRYIDFIKKEEGL